MNTTNLMQVFNEEAPDVAKAFGSLIQAVAAMPALEPKIKQLIYIAMRAAQGETTAVNTHVLMAKQVGVTRDELKEAILMTTTVCGIKGVASCLIPALETFDKTQSLLSITLAERLFILSNNCTYTIARGACNATQGSTSGCIFFQFFLKSSEETTADCFFLQSGFQIALCLLR